MYCPNCGTFSQPGAKFCYNCGAVLPVSPPVPQMPPQQPAVVFPPQRPAEPAVSFPPQMPAEPAAPELPAEPAGKKGSHWVPLVILAALSVLGLVLFFLLPLGTGGAPSASGELPWFMLDDGTLYFDESLYSGSPELTVPEQINGRTVVFVGDYCFSYCNEITTVTLPDTVTEIGEYAFAGCAKLRVIEIPESVTSIGASAFADCTGLEAIHIPSSVTQIGSAAFRRCSSLDYIFFDGTFEQWTGLYDGKVNPNITVCCTDGNYPLS